MAQENTYPAETPEMLKEVDDNTNGISDLEVGISYQKLLLKKNGVLEGVRILNDGSVYDFYSKTKSSKNWTKLGQIPEKYVSEISKLAPQIKGTSAINASKNIVLLRFTIDDSVRYVLRESSLIDKKSASFKINNLINKGLKNQFFE